MLKWLDRLNGLEAAADGQAAAGAKQQQQQQQYSVLDVAGEVAEVRCSSTGVNGFKLTWTLATLLLHLMFSCKAFSCCKHSVRPGTIRMRSKCLLHFKGQNLDSIFRCQKSMYVVVWCPALLR
jgi:hypothetical protein